MILTEQEIRKLQTQHPTENNPMPFARAIETLIEERLKAQEPVAKIVVTTSSRYKKEQSTLLATVTLKRNLSRTKQLLVRCFCTPTHSHRMTLCVTWKPSPA